MSSGGSQPNRAGRGRLLAISFGRGRTSRAWGRRGQGRGPAPTHANAAQDTRARENPTRPRLGFKHVRGMRALTSVASAGLDRVVSRPAYQVRRARFVGGWRSALDRLTSPAARIGNSQRTAARAETGDAILSIERSIRALACWESAQRVPPRPAIGQHEMTGAGRWASGNPSRRCGSRTSGPTQRRYGVC